MRRGTPSKVADMGSPGGSGGMSSAIDMHSSSGFAGVWRFLTLCLHRGVPAGMERGGMGSHATWASWLQRCVRFLPELAIMRVSSLSNARANRLFAGTLPCECASMFFVRGRIGDGASASVRLDRWAAA